MNEQNLIPNSQRSRKELQEMGRKGGIKSGEVRRHNRELRKLARWMLRDAMKNITAELHLVKGGADHDQ